MTDNAPKSVGLDGDGDEIAAINDVEHAFGVTLDYDDAPGWVTAGDVFRSLQKALPPDELNSADLWNRFSVALCGQTGVNPNEIEQNSPLLKRGFRFWAWLANASGVVWIVVAALILALLAATVLRLV